MTGGALSIGRGRVRTGRQGCRDGPLAKMMRKSTVLNRKCGSGRSFEHQRQWATLKLLQTYAQTQVRLTFALFEVWRRVDDLLEGDLQGKIALYSVLETVLAQGRDVRGWVRRRGADGHIEAAELDEASGAPLWR
jgi:hypothetical protein